MSSADARHPEAGLLLQLLDGELPSRQARRIRRHVEACWQCRTELDQLQRTVGDCVRLRQNLGEAAPPPPQPWRDLEREFSRIDAGMEKRSLLRRPVARWIALAATAASLVAATLTLRKVVFRPLAPANPPVAQSIPSFAPKSSPASTAVRAEGRAPSAGVRASVPQEAPIAPATAGDELQVAVALHRLGADLGEPVEIAREDGNVVVSGAGLAPELQQQIREALSSLPHVAVRFSDPAGLPPESAGTRPALPRPEAPPLPTRLTEQLGGRTQFANFSTQLLDHTDAAMTRVYALRRLAREFPIDREQQLTSSDRALVRQMGREHVEALRMEITAIDRTAAPVLAALGASQPQPASGNNATNWQQGTEDLFRSARRMETLLAAFLGAAAPEQPADNLPQQVAAGLAQSQRDVQQCERLLVP